MSAAVEVRQLYACVFTAKQLTVAMQTSDIPMVCMCRLRIPVWEEHALAHVHMSTGVGEHLQHRQCDDDGRAVRERGG